MYVPREAHIAGSKLIEYLLQPRTRNDKSAFLAQAGFTQDNPEVLESAIRELIHVETATSDRVDQYGEYYVVVGKIHGPAGSLEVTTVWIRLHGQNVFRFVTLKPTR
jgi:hypothetical protein